jgi:hypothetical protein
MTAFLARFAVPLQSARNLAVQWRRPLIAGALVLFLAGTVWSFAGLGLKLAEIDLVAMAILVLPVGLLQLAYSATSLVLLARTAGVRIGFADAMRASARAQMAEALPLPGGAIVRTAALVAAGSPPTRSAALVIGTALLWIALASAAAGVMLITPVPLAGWTLLGGGIAVSLAALVHVARLGGLANAALTLLQRIAGLGVAALRVALAFAAVGAAVSLSETLPYVLAAIAGSASSLVPGGLGVSEALGALMAGLVRASPESAFLALAVSRVTQFLGTAIFAPFLEFRAPRGTLPETR